MSCFPVSDKMNNHHNIVKTMSVEGINNLLGTVCKYQFTKLNKIVISLSKLNSSYSRHRFPSKSKIYTYYNTLLPNGETKYKNEVRYICK